MPRIRRALLLATLAAPAFALFPLTEPVPAAFAAEPPAAKKAETAEERQQAEQDKAMREYTAQLQ